MSELNMIRVSITCILAMREFIHTRGEAMVAGFGYYCTMALYITRMNLSIDS